MIQTATGYTGTAIDLFTSASTPALKVNNIGIGAGIQATAMSGNAIYASSAGSGNAALLERSVVYRTGANTATLKVDSDGNLNIQTSVTTKGLTVNSAPVGGSSKSVTDTATGSQTKSVDLKPSFGTGNAYTLTGAQVLYWDTTQTGNNKDWKPMPAANVTYNECVNGVFTAGLTLVNPIANAVNYRIFITYTTATVGCPGADTTPPAITNVGGVGVAANWWVGGATTASPIALKATINDAGGVDNTVNFVKFKLDGVNINTTAPAKAGNTYTISPNWTPAFANNTTSPPVGATSPETSQCTLVIFTATALNRLPYPCK